MSLLSRLTVSTIGLFSKTLLSPATSASVTVNGLDNLKKALADDERSNGRGIITDSFHKTHSLDDPGAWGVLPLSHYWNCSRMTRWTLGASDVIFTNPMFSHFFRAGQVIETFRGKGIFQPAIDDAIQRLNQGDWIHFFSEGKVNPASCDPKSPMAGKLLRFKWGVGRVIMEAQHAPIIIPMWITGFDKLMPEGRSFPYKYIPQRGAHISVTFGEPVLADELRDTLSTLISRRGIPGAPRGTSGGLGDPVRLAQETHSAEVAMSGWLHGPVAQALHGIGDGEAAIEIARVRSAVTAVIQRDVEKLGRRILGIQT
ncbi:acyltransferase-domain-containing protein [Epithele typhae]|uniref:acyltransferase-domain-containing protein n=1 Tax=Epithele typhae TaxID=378194 RepID=UPI00200816D7|nr:acyltransferase-domain-containing protein [Epithele typhae]KAH9939644.1 acyltransferase-domain-containing protein [Epithele typhae]